MAGFGSGASSGGWGRAYYQRVGAATTVRRGSARDCGAGGRGRALLFVTDAFAAGYGTSIRLANARQLLAWPLRFGSEMVVLFLLVSGFALACSEQARLSQGKARTPTGSFFRRRVWRFGPVYYVAVAWGLLTFLVPWGTTRRPGELAANFPITWDGTLAHLALVHNLHPKAWAVQANGPLWSMAYEAQCYLLFPLLYGLLRRATGLQAWGILAVVFIVAHELPGDGPLLVRAFSLGMVIGMSAESLRRVPETLLLGGGLVLLGVGMLDLRHVTLSPTLHTAVWLGAFALLLLGSLRSPASLWNPANLPAIRWVGKRSYSLYALHYPVVLLLFNGLTLTGLGATAVALAALITGLPIALLLADASYRWLEEPSMLRARAAS